MIWQRLISWLAGYIEIIVRGPHLEKLLNLITNSGILLWDVRRLSTDLLHAKVRAYNLARIRIYLRRCNCKITIRRKRGYPFLYRTLSSHKLFLLGLIAFILGLFWVSTHVFFIKVNGFNDLARQKLVTTLVEAGLKPGILRNELLRKIRLIEQEAILKTPQAVWLGITVRGVVAQVKVIPRKLPLATPKSYDVIAAQDGVIEKLILIRGVPVVQEGDTVARGDLLISGTGWRGNPETGELVKEEVPACGIVKARTWRSFETVEPKIIWRPAKQSNRRFSYQLRWGRKIWTLWGRSSQQRRNAFHYRMRKRLYQGRNPWDVVELIKDTWQDVNWQRVRRSLPEVKQAALNEVVTSSAYRVQYRNNHPTLSWSDEGNFLKLTLTMETVEDIAVYAKD